MAWGSIMINIREDFSIKGYVIAIKPTQAVGASILN
jgi:hypothetical protein